MSYKEFINLRPDQLEEEIKRYPLALVPIGALEWHSYHLPLGLDGLKAEALLRKTAEKIGKGIIFPCRFWGSINAMNFPYTHQISRRNQKKFYKDMVKWLYKMGFRIIVILTGHYPSSQIRFVKKASKSLMKKYNDAYIIGITECFLLYDLGYFGDHAAKWETNLAMALFGDLVDLENLPDGLNYIDRCKQLGIMGQDPKISSSIEEGKQAAELFSDRLLKLIEDVNDKESQKPIKNMYNNYSIAYKSLIDLKNLDPTMKMLGMDEKKDFLRMGKWMFLESSKQKKSLFL